MSSATPKITNTRQTAGAAAALAQHVVERMRLLVLSLFFLSGVSALIYEVAWVRMLSLSFGVSVYAVSTVLSVYMAGFALGSWLFGRRAAQALTLPFAERVNLPPALMRYVILQLGIGVYALLTPALFGGLTAMYAAAGQSGMLSPVSGAALRIILAVLALLVPTTLMGGTLPVLSQYLAAAGPGRARVIGSLYAVNTFGAVLGTLAAGLVLIRFAGTNAAIYLAAGLDLLVALIAIRALNGTEPDGAGSSAPDSGAETRLAAPPRPVSRKQKRNAARAEAAAAAIPAPVAPISARQRQIVLWGYALSGFAALGYQVVWTRLLSIFTLNAVFSFTIMLATFLAGLAIGSSLLAGRIAGVRRPLALFGTLQLAVGISAILVLFVFARLPSLIQLFTSVPDYATELVVELFTSAITIFVPTLLLGTLFPVAARIYGEHEPQPRTPEGLSGKMIGRLYAFNTLGAMLGALAAGFVLIPAIGLQHSALVLAAINIAVGLAAFLLAQPVRLVPRRTLLGLAGVTIAALLAALLLPPGYYLGFREGAIPELVFYDEGVDATVAVFEVKNPPLKVSFVNGRNEVPTDAQSMRAFYVLGHLPPLLKPDAQQALMVSFGNGIATGAMSRHNIPHIQAVELVAGQVEAARLYSAENRNVLANPAVQIAHEDGRNYLLQSSERYDIITADATHPINTSSWALFTTEFYTLVKQHLADDGVFVQWLPFHDLSREDYRAIVGTFHNVFPHTTLFYTGGVHTFLVATPQPLTREQVAALNSRIQALGIGDDLGDGAKLAGDMLMDEQGVAAYTTGARLVYDDTAFFIPSKNEPQILESFAPFALK